MFSEVLHIDCTSDTNVESCPHLTITGRDSTGSMFMAVRVSLPNERAWVFRWIFQTVMPTLLGREYISRVNVMITDGDSQETHSWTSQLHSTFSTFVVFDVVGTLSTVVGSVFVLLKGLCHVPIKRLSS